MVSGRLSAEGFNKPSAENETERKNAAILDLQELIDSGEQERHDLQQFMKKYTQVYRSPRTYGGNPERFG